MLDATSSILQLLQTLMKASVPAHQVSENVLSTGITGVPAKVWLTCILRRLSMQVKTIGIGAGMDMLQETTMNLSKLEASALKEAGQLHIACNIHVSG